MYVRCKLFGIFHFAWHFFISTISSGWEEGGTKKERRKTESESRSKRVIRHGNSYFPLHK